MSSTRNLRQRRQHTIISSYNTNQVLQIEVGMDLQSDYQRNTGCEFCTGFIISDRLHSRKTCPLFKQLKRKTSQEPYIAVNLKENDEDGYAAAGIFFGVEVAPMI